MADLYDAVIDVESSRNPRATSIKGARGLMQITQPALDDYNNYTGAGHTMDEMYDPEINTKVGKWYLASRIPSMLRSYKLPVTPDNVLWAYNGGIGRVKKNIMPPETADYIQKVKKRMGR
jgi:soluble lytic murein transglycosylase